jgi:alpha-glucuronidase
VNRGREDWTSVYYHRADTIGIGFNRTTSGSDAVSQYAAELKELYNNRESCPENLLLWFHHVPWDYKLSTGRTLWDELCFRYHDGVNSVRNMMTEWERQKNFVDSERFGQVKALLEKQERDAKIWRDGCLLYFQTFSRKPFPAGLEKPEHDLQYYINYRYTDIPGISRGM